MCDMGCCGASCKAARWIEAGNFKGNACDAAQPPAPPPEPERGWTGRDSVLVALYIALLPVLALFVRTRALQARGGGGRMGWKQLLGLAAVGEGGAGEQGEDAEWREELLPTGGEGGRGQEDGGELPKTLGEEPAYPAVEAWLRRWYFRQASIKPSSLCACKGSSSNRAQQRSCMQQTGTDQCSGASAARDCMGQGNRQPCWGRQNDAG